MGNSSYEGQKSPYEPVHPHACGELKSWRFISPNTLRFIPTLVGNSNVLHVERAVFPVHPHACGELNKGHDGFSLVGGSSPRLWGTQYLLTAGYIGCRFIPTLVGNSGAIMTSEDYGTVHPHACGELHWLRE